MEMLRSMAFAGTFAMMCSGAQAEELTIGIDYEPSIDPQFLYTVNNIAISRHIFDALVEIDAKQQLNPSLATAWERIDPLTWEFTLREGIEFHDGSTFDAQDVIYSIGRVASIENNPNPYTPVVRSIDSVEADGNILRITTQYPDPILPAMMAVLSIVSSELGDVGPEEFRSGEAAIGTGPYEFVSYAPGERLVLERNDDYWGDVEPWDGVTFRIIPDNSARLIALLSGEVDAINNVDPSNAETVRENPDLQLATGPSSRIIYLILDSLRETTPMVTGTDTNPLRDPLVREAISLSIDREGLVAQIMEGLAEPAYALAPDFLLGAGNPVPGNEYDPERARALLAEAGYPNGFSITINGPNNRYLNDASVMQAVGQMLARIGLDVQVITEPFNVYFSKIRVEPGLEGMEYSLMLMGWGHNTGDTSGLLGTVLHSYDSELGLGSGNRSGYEDEALDTMIEEAMAADISGNRADFLGQAMTAALQTYTTIPLFVPYSVIAGRAGLDITTRGDEMLLATEIRPKN